MLRSHAVVFSQDESLFAALPAREIDAIAAVAIMDRKLDRMHLALRNKGLEISRLVIVFLVRVEMAAMLVWRAVFE
jgi:hypothetical protein